MSLLLLMFFVVICQAEPLSSKELIFNAKTHDGAVISYKGELVGEIMVRGDYAWLNLNDGANAIGVWTPNEETAGLLAGSYNARGDVLEVSGIFHRACVEHGGDLDIHAQTVVLVEKGNQIVHQLNASIVKFSAILFVALLVLVFWRRKK